jgi:hypothetical protein
MPGGRPPGPHSVRRPDHEAITIARLQGESDGRTMGRISERSAIVEWLKWQSGTPKDLATRISNGEHTHQSRNP